MGIYVVEVDIDDEEEQEAEDESDELWMDLHCYKCFFASRAPGTEHVRKWKVNKTSRGKANLQKRGKVIRYQLADAESHRVLDAAMLKEWNQRKELNAIERISMEEAHNLIGSASLRSFL